jgi:hypothetical protein
MKAAGPSSKLKTHGAVSHFCDFYTVSNLGNQLQATFHVYSHLSSPENKISLYQDLCQHGNDSEVALTFY